MKRRTFLFSAGVAAVSACASPAVRRKGLALSGELDAVLERVLATGVTPGLCVAVYSREGTFARGFGVQDVVTGQLADADTAFYIASSTKSFTALALAILHQRRAFDLGATLSAYAPDAGFPSVVRPGEVTFRHMLAHTSGISNNALVYRVAFTGQHDPETLWRLLATCAPNEKAPFGRYQYTNVDYNITTVLTDRRLGVLWQDLLARDIFAPAGMMRTSARMSRGQAAGWRIAKPHALGFSGGLERVYLEKTDQTMQSAGGMIMSANDALRWLELMIEDGRVAGRQVVLEQAVIATREPIADVGGMEFEGYKREHYGLGWQIGPYRSDRMFHHFGGFAGFSAHVSYIPARQVGVAAFANSSSGGLAAANAVANFVYDRTGGYDDADERLAAALGNILKRRADFTKHLEEARAERAGRQWQLSRPMAAYSGQYENEQWGRIEISPKGSTLEIRFGIMHALVEPYPKPEALRVELIPGNGDVIDFEMGAQGPLGLNFLDARFVRV